MIKYPNGKSNTYNNKIIHSNRGMKLEDDINTTNQYYLDHNIAVIYKKPIPIQIVNVDFKERSATKITEAYFKVPSTTDYNGIYKGNYIDFEAKETKNKTLFPIANIHEHQIQHIKKVTEHGGISFLIVRFASLDKTFLYKGTDLDRLLKEGKKSITLQEFEKNGYLIKQSYTPRLDYLKALKTAYFKE